MAPAPAVPTAVLPAVAQVPAAVLPPLTLAPPPPAPPRMAPPPAPAAHRTRRPVLVAVAVVGSVAVVVAAALGLRGGPPVRGARDAAVAGTGAGVPTGAVATSGAPVLATSAQPGIPVTPAEAADVAHRLWQARVAARAAHDAPTLRLIDAGPALDADLGAGCDACTGRPPSARSTTVNLPPQAVWPVDFFATVTFGGAACAAEACVDSFVAAQASAGAPWHIVLLVTSSGAAGAGAPAPGSGGFAAPPAALPDRQFANLPAEYAQYLQSLTATGQPGLTRLAPGPFTSGLAHLLYHPPAAQQAAGRSETVAYSAVPGDPVWRFATAGGQVTCGTVQSQATVRPLPGRALVQPADRSAFGSLAPGAYSSVVTRAVRMVCFEAYPGPKVPVTVLGTWGATTAVTGTAAAA
ncbi:MAG TPA: hypothetical protein VMU14_04555 [Acidimicrobiales bacterium]|nr:hypothetical protein [Acidimicrobiales bacterium]